MNCLPVIAMEMRSASRRTWTFGLRLLFALAGAAACLVVLILPHLSPAQKGQTMLVLLSFLGLFFCLAAGGFLTADCVSSEKREGTLGLLFLTPLTGMDIVLGKMVCHGLQMFYGVCAVFPVFFLPMFTGGVTWAEVSRIVLALVLALLLSAAVGMLVSVLGLESRRTILATFASIVLITAVPMLYLLVQRTFLHHPADVLPQISPVFAVVSGFDSSYRLPSGPTRFWGSLALTSGLTLTLVILAGVLVGRVFQAAGAVGGSHQKRSAPHVPGSVSDENPYEWMVLRGAGEARALGWLTALSILFFVVMLVLSVSTKYWGEAFSTWTGRFK